MVSRLPVPFTVLGDPVLSGHNRVVTHNRRQILDLLEANGLRPSRALGQNFVADANTVRRIARMAELKPGDRVVEVGAGLASLTLALVEAGASVTAIELDRHLLPVLRSVVSDFGVTVIEGDALRLDWNAVVPPEERAVLVANLPYNVGTIIVAEVLDCVPQVERLVVMVQKEVAQRLVAGVGDRQYGALSVKVRYHAVPKMLGTVPPTVFVPQPDVDSAVIELRRRPAPAVSPQQVAPEELFEVVKAGFAQRRKMLRRALSGVVPADAFECAGIEPTARAEELDVEAWGRLAACRTASGTKSR